jgi:hypothetical protein
MSAPARRWRKDAVTVDAQVADDLEVLGELELEILFHRRQDKASTPAFALAMGDRPASRPLRREEEEMDVRIDLRDDRVIDVEKQMKTLQRNINPERAILEPERRMRGRG